MTAEFAVAMVGVTTVLLLVLATALVGSAQVRAQLAAGAGARAAARGESPAAVDEEVRALAGPGATTASSRTAPSGTASTTGVTSVVEITVSRSVTLLLPGAPALVVHAHAAALVEGAEPDEPSGLGGPVGPGG